MTLDEINSTVSSDDEGELTLTRTVASSPTEDQIITRPESQDESTRRKNPYSGHNASTGHQINGRNVTKSAFEDWLSGGKIIGGSDNSITNVTSTEVELTKSQSEDKSGSSKSARRRQRRRKATLALPSSAAGPSETTDSPEKDNSEVLTNCQSTEETKMSRSAKRRKRRAEDNQKLQSFSKNTHSNQSKVVSEKDDSDVDEDFGQAQTEQDNIGPNVKGNLAFDEARQKNYGDTDILVVSNEARGNSKQLNGGGMMIDGNAFFGN
ncbi:uncharacterized protein I206_104553 [Kwoniella pini CBS 10737]|uniref:Uncharacterized protein n=1 Tax=Kwoniella pini CBS 10737 TaxID=1296096 RepID=A0A1B9I742_9TREE|nr:uncharacterized protein I206_02087 [Kwoniella pini CBS 10737]OCF51373.1 hypothetical protein I206_02087 [Kwoniella pini CBS 10737]